MKPDTLPQFDAGAMLDQVQTWCAINTGTGNLEGLARQAELLRAAFSNLPGVVELVDAAPVTAIAARRNDAAIAVNLWVRAASSRAS